MKTPDASSMWILFSDSDITTPMTSGYAELEKGGNRMIKLDYVVNPKDPANGILEVELHVLAIYQDMPEVYEIGEKSWSYKDLDDPVVFFEAFGASGKSLTSAKLDAHHWRVEADSADSLRLCYTAQLSNHYIGHRDSFMDASSALILGRQIFITPKDVSRSDITVYFRLPPDWETYTPWQQKNDRYVLGHKRHLTGAWFGLGNYVSDQISVDKAQITVAASTELQCTPACLAKYIRDVLLEQAKIFDAVVEESKLFIFTRGDRGAGGTPGWRSLSLSLTSDFTDEMILAPKDMNEMLAAHVIAHEIFHTWPTGYPEEGQFGWFSEGFTDYYAFLTLCRMGYLSRIDFHKRLQRENKGLMSDELARQTPLGDTNELDSQGKPHGIIHYIKGMLFAFLLDIEIRRRTDGKKNLDVFMRRMSDEFGAGTHGYCNEDMVCLLDDITGQDMSSLFDDYVYGTRIIDLEDLLRYDSEGI